MHKADRKVKDKNSKIIYIHNKQCNSGSPSHSNQRKKRNKNSPKLKVRSKNVCRYHDIIYTKS